VHPPLHRFAKGAKLEYIHTMATPENTQCDKGSAHNRTTRIRGIFSQRQAGTIGAGTTESMTYWFAKENALGKIIAQVLDDEFIPAGMQETFDRKDFLKRFTLEPEIWYQQVTQRLIMGEKYRQTNQFIEAQIEYKRILAIDEDNIRANFGLGLVYLTQEEGGKAAYVFEKLVGLQESFMPEHKHLFNEFGIALRKKHMFSEAIRYYHRAIELTQKDENLYLNLARAHFENGENAPAFANLRVCLEINKLHGEARSFLKYMARERLLPTGDDVMPFVRAALQSPNDADDM
jgi:tetratricopeptide (TPR) repeat protein